MPSTADEEARLVAQVVAGDQSAFANLAQRHMGMIEAYAFRTTGDAARAQDIAQEVMLRLWQRAGTFDPARARLTTWLHQIAHNLCMDVFRQTARLTALDGEEPGEVAEEAMDTNSDNEIQRALSRLPERQRTALVLTYYQSLPNRDVAEIMDLSIRAVESLLVRARKAIKQCLEEAQ